MRVGNWRAAGVVLVCSTPSIGFNVWPVASAMMAGAAASDAPIWLALQGLAVVIMAACPVVIFDAAGVTIGQRSAAAALGLVLLVFNVMNAITIASHRQESGVSHNRGAMQSAAGIASDLARAVQAREAIPAFRAASAGQVKAAQAALETAKANRSAECDKRGDKCKAREDDQTRAAGALREVEERRDLTDEARRLDDEIKRLRSAQTMAGATPTSEDPGADRNGALLAAFGIDMGASPAATFAKWWPVFQGLVCELIAMLGPVVVLALLSRGSATPPKVAKPRVPIMATVERDSRDTSAATVGAIVDAIPLATLDATVGATLSPPAATVAEIVCDTPPVVVGAEPATVAEPLEIHVSTVAPEPWAAIRESVAQMRAIPVATVAQPAATVGGTLAAGSVAAWRELATVEAKGAKWKPADAYAHYTNWCNGEHIEPESLTAFGSTLVKIGVQKESKSNRIFYLDIAAA